MDPFRFSPELFEIRADVMESLEQAGYQWLSHYSSVDCLHDLYGIEVCGIHQKGDSVAIEDILRQIFPKWNVGCLCYKDYGRETGWKARVYRDKSRQRESWEMA